MNFDHKKVGEIIRLFEEISKIPRCSKNEKKIAEWLMNWAKENNFESNTDNTGNLLIKVPASPGYENSPIVIIQGHMDMVCEKTPDSDHDFSKDPIKFVYEGEWLTADKTTLGADNGIAIAMGLVLALDNKINHPPLELLFTVDEETGLTGANALEPGFMDGRILINVDSEDEGVFTVGCAGGMNTYLSLPIDYEDIPTDYEQYKINAGGMKGGHSGIDINQGKANAIRILGRILYQIKNENIDIRIADIKGGSAHNAIPRDSESFIFFKKNEFERVKNIVSKYSNIIKNEFKNTDPDLAVTIEVNTEKKYDKALTENKTEKVINFILSIPHGVAAMSPDIADLVETSNNFANIKIEENLVKILTSQRSSIISRINFITNRIEAVARLAGGNAHSGDGYPPWPPDMDSPLLERSLKLYERMFNKKPTIEVIHAGLECGIIGDKNPGMDMISIGPTLKYPHSPDEKIHIGSIGKVWDFIVELFKELK